MFLSDFFSAWPFHVATINGLPPVYFIGQLSLSTAVYIILVALSVYSLVRHRWSLRRIFHKQMSTYILIIWFALCALFFVQRMFQVQAEYAAFSGQTLEQMREITTDDGYYGFIEFVKRHVPQREGVMVFLPLHDDYFNQKTEYYLYPLRIAHDGRYLAVFHADSTVSFDENRETFTYKNPDGKAIMFSPVQRIAVYKEGEELYHLIK